jgi:hypothetical protein
MKVNGNSISEEEFIEGILEIQRSATGLAAIPEVAEDCWDVAADSEFWDNLTQIKEVGINKNIDRALWLTTFTQIDDLGPMGRSLFLSRAALLALQRMPRAALDAAVLVNAQMASDSSPYRKIGICKVLEASGLPEAIPLIEDYLEDSHEYVRSEALRSLSHLKGNHL